MILGIFFLSLRNIDFWVDIEKSIWRSYKVTEALPITIRLELIKEKKFAKAGLDENSSMFVIYVVALKAEALIHLSQAAQIAVLK